MLKLKTKFGVALLFNLVIGVIVVAILLSSAIGYLGGNRVEEAMAVAKGRVNILKSTETFVADLDRLAALMNVDDPNSVDGYEGQLETAIAKFKASFNDMTGQLGDTGVVNIGVPRFFGNNAASDKAVRTSLSDALVSQTTSLTGAIDSVQRSMDKIVALLKGGQGNDGSAVASAIGQAFTQANPNIIRFISQPRDSSYESTFRSIETLRSQSKRALDLDLGDETRNNKTKRAVKGFEEDLDYLQATVQKYMSLNSQLKTMDRYINNLVSKQAMVAAAIRADASASQVLAIDSAGDAVSSSNGTNLVVSVLMVGFGLAAMGGFQWLVVGPLTRCVGAVRSVADDNFDGVTPPAGIVREIEDLRNSSERFKQNAKERMRLEQMAEEDRLAKMSRQAVVERSVAEFRENVSSIVEKIRDEIMLLSGTSDSLYSVSVDASTVADDTNRASNLSVQNIQALASAAEELAASVGEIAAQVTGTVGAVGIVADRAKIAESIVSALLESGDRIGAVVSMIEEIASQTNLLALNATIEATRAGAAGRGFAVVAGEVKSLAAKTAEATAEISRRVQDIRTSSTGAAQAIDEITGSVEVLNRYSTLIAAAIEEQRASTEEIARNAAHVSTSTTKVQQRIETIKSSVSKTQTAAHDVSESSQRVSTEIQSMATAVRSFMENVA